MRFKTTNKNVAEIYQVTDDYQRFNSKYSMIWQPRWNAKYENCGLDAIEKKALRKSIEKNKPGFSTLDWAFYKGASGSIRASNFPNNVPNQRGNSWNPLEPVPEGLTCWKEDESTTAKIVKKIALMYGADLVGICKLDRRWVYSHYYSAKDNREYPIAFSDEGYESITEPTVLADGTQVIPGSMKYVVVIIHSMEYNPIRTSPTLTHMATVFLNYSRIAYTGVNTAEFIRNLGYHAIPSANDTALNIPLAIEAGLGQLGRNAKMISPIFGARCRISKIITDLPMEVDKPIDFGVTDFCNRCQICADVCPSRAIPTGDRCYEPTGDYSNAHVLQWQVKHDKCRHFQSQYGSNCGLCIVRCPYSLKHGVRHQMLLLASSRLPLLNVPMAALVRKYGFFNKLLTPQVLDPADFWKA